MRVNVQGLGVGVSSIKWCVVKGLKSELGMSSTKCCGVKGMRVDELRKVDRGYERTIEKYQRTRDGGVRSERSGVWTKASKVKKLWVLED